MEPFQPRSGSGGRSDATGARRRPAAISQLRAAAVAAASGAASVRVWQITSGGRRPPGRWPPPQRA